MQSHQDVYKTKSFPIKSLLNMRRIDELDANDYFHESLDDLQIKVNQLRSEDGEEQLAAIQFFADFLDDGQFIPPSLFIQFRNDIVNFLNFVSQLPELQLSNILRIIADILEFFEDDYPYSNLLQTIWQLLPNEDAFNAIGQILLQAPLLAQEFFQNEETHDALIGFLHNEDPTIRNSGLFLLCSLSENPDNHIMLHDMFEDVCNTLAAGEETEDNIESILTIIKLFAKSDSGITYISERADLGHNLHSIMGLTFAPKMILGLILNIAQTSSHCLKIIQKLDFLDFIISNVNNDVSEDMKYTALHILYCVAQDGEEGAKIIFDSQILQSLLDQSSKGQKIHRMCISVIAACMYGGSSEIINALVEAGFLDVIIEYLEESVDSVVNEMLLALQSIISNAEIQGNETLLTSLVQNNELIDKLFYLTTEKEGEDEGRIAELLYKKLADED